VTSLSSAMHTKPEVKTTPGDRFSGEGGSQYLVDSGDGDGGGGAGDLARGFGERTDLQRESGSQSPLFEAFFSDDLIISGD